MRGVANKWEYKQYHISVRLTGNEYQEVLDFCKRKGIVPSVALRMAIRELYFDTDSRLFMEPGYLKKVVREKANRTVILRTRIDENMQDNLSYCMINRHGKNKSELIADSLLRLCRNQQ